MYCNFCGEKIDDSSVFCSKCGTKLNKTDKTEPIILEEIASSTTPIDATKIINEVKEESINQPILKSKFLKYLDKFSFWGTILGLVGLCGFSTISLVGLIVYGTIYLYGGFDYTIVLTTICTIFMLIGLCCVVTRFIIWFILKKGKQPTIIRRILLILMAIICLGFSICSFIDCNNNSDNNSNGGGSSGGGYVSFSYVYTLCDGAYPWASYGIDYLSIDTNPYDYDSDSYLSSIYSSAALSAIQTANIAFSLPSYIYNEMMETRALDGRQTYSGTKVNVSWRYHPDSGLEVRYTQK